MRKYEATLGLFICCYTTNSVVY